MAKEQEASRFLAEFFGGVTVGQVFVTSLANDRNDAAQRPPRYMCSRNMEQIERFVRKHDGAGRGMFFCVATLQDSAKRRAKETLRELPTLHADIDFKGIEIEPAEAEAIVRTRLLAPPSRLVHSGHGLHGYWRLKTPLPATPENIARMEQNLRLLADHVGGDPSVCEVSRLMRLPGSTNTKDNEALDVRVLLNSEQMYDIEALEEWLLKTSPLIKRKAMKPYTADPWSEYAERVMRNAGMDVEKRLQDMRYHGSGDDSIHQTQLHVSASLLNKGAKVDEVVAVLIEATKRAAGSYGEHWNWHREEHNLRDMCKTFMRKHPDVNEKARPAVVSDEQAQATVGNNVVNLQTERDKKQRKGKEDKPDGEIASLVAGTLAVMRERGRDLLITDELTYVYKTGAWDILEKKDAKTMRVLLHEGCTRMKVEHKTGLINAAEDSIMNHPDLFQPALAQQWSDTKIALENGTFDLASNSFVPQWEKDWRVTRRMPITYEEGATCPHTLAFFQSCFADRPAVAQVHIDLLQEFFGMALLVEFMHREQRKAMILVGPSRTGKTETADLLSYLVGSQVGANIASCSIAEISDRFGLQCFINAVAWIRDDAVNEGDKLDPQRFKTIVTGERIAIACKYGGTIVTELHMPVLFTVNNLPYGRDSSDGVINRCMIVYMTNEISEDQAIAERATLGVGQGQSLASWLWEHEAAGIFAWAVEGARRLKARGKFLVPPEVTAAAIEFKDASNPVSAWARANVQQAPGSWVHRSDLLCSFHGWLREEEGSEAHMRGARWFIPRLRAACSWADFEAKDTKGERYVSGIKLTELGLAHWQRQHERQHLPGNHGHAESAHLVNIVARRV